MAGLNCGTNPFHYYCDSGYNDARETACRAGSTNTQCGGIISGICSGNPFDTLCRNTTVYLNARKTHCRSTWNDPRCPATIRAVCGVDPFDRMCNSVYDTPRETACRNGSTNTQCGGIISGICGGNPFDPLCGNGYTTNRRDACTDNPFAPRCAGEGYNDLRVSFCDKAANADNPACPTPQVTAGVWADSFDTPLSHGATADDTEDQFLIGRETDLDTGGVKIRSGQGKLNFADATFNRVTLGGDATGGMAYFTAGRLNDGGYYNYAGILSGTNLGAPLTQTQGTAKWIGSVRYTGFYPTDFVLNISFGTGDGAGEIEAIVQPSWWSFDYHILGEFDDAGVITGTARRGNYYTYERVPSFITAKLTGLIGEEGAVGTFISTNNYHTKYNSDRFAGGFVARPPSAEELRTLEETCADDPFHKHCTIGYESARDVLIKHCIIGDNANDESCDVVNEWSVCVKTPFDYSDYCDVRLSGYYDQIRGNRVAFCRTVGNEGNALCTVETTFSHICRNYSFDAQCLGDSDYDRTREIACRRAGTGSTQCRLLAGLNCGTNPFHYYCDSGYNDARETACRNGSTNTQCGGIISGICGGNPFDTLCGNGYTQNRRDACTDNPFATRCAGEGYNDLRVSFCDKAANAGNPACPTPEPTTPQVTAKVWADSFDEPLAHGVTAEDTESKFLIGRATDLDTGGRSPYSNSPNRSGNLNLADATFNGVALGGDRADGVAFFGAERANNGKLYSYVGILEGTNLGAPLTDTEGSAKWIGAFQAEGHSPVDFCS